jgi:ABC-type dipeptide/oligopeptide/nickel transport system permease component
MAIASPNMHSTQKVITDTDKSLLVQVLVLMFVVIFLFSCSIRIGTKIRMTKTLTVDDMLTIVATVGIDLISRFT